MSKTNYGDNSNETWRPKSKCMDAIGLDQIHRYITDESTAEKIRAQLMAVSPAVSPTTSPTTSPTISGSPINFFDFLPLHQEGWLAKHEEVEQTFSDFVGRERKARCGTNNSRRTSCRVDEKRYKIYLAPIGEFKSSSDNSSNSGGESSSDNFCGDNFNGNSPSLLLLQQFASAYFGLPVILMDEFKIILPDKNLSMTNLTSSDHDKNTRASRNKNFILIEFNEGKIDDDAKIGGDGKIDDDTKIDGDGKSNGDNKSRNEIKSKNDIDDGSKEKKNNKRQTKIKFRPNVNTEKVKLQLLTGDIENMLMELVPDDAICILGLTMYDLYPNNKFNFVFGEASPSQRVGIFSFARYAPSPDENEKDYKHAEEKAKSYCDEEKNKYEAKEIKDCKSGEKFLLSKSKGGEKVMRVDKSSELSLVSTSEKKVNGNNNDNSNNDNDNDSNNNSNNDKDYKDNKNCKDDKNSKDRKEKLKTDNEAKNFSPPIKSTNHGELLWRSCNVMAHELFHLFGVEHCQYFNCIMNGSNSVEELSSHPLELCPVCFHKLVYSIFKSGQYSDNNLDSATLNSFIPNRYEALMKFYLSLPLDLQSASFEKERKWLERRLSIM